MRDIEKRLLKLEQRIARNKAPPPTVAYMHHGEDARLAEGTLVYEIVGELPRPEYATRESVLEALPLAKRWLVYKYNDEGERQAEEGVWRGLCELAGIDYDSVEAEGPVTYRPRRHD